MIVVIADDFTGAAEVAGLALEKGLRVIVGSSASVKPTTDVDVLVLVADTRSMPEAAAVKLIRRLTREVLQLKPDYIYKKVDSVLRGHLYLELCEQQACERKHKVMVLAGNPNFNRLIIDGIFYVNGQKLAHTSFAHDLEFPATSSSVVKLLKSANCQSLKITEQLPEEGFYIGDVDSMETLQKWMSKLDNSWVIGGGAACFECLLQKVFPRAIVRKAKSAYQRGAKSIVFFGSNFPKGDNFMQTVGRLGLQHFNLNEAFFLQNKEELIEQKAKEVVSLSLSNETVLISSLFKITDHRRLNPSHIRETTGKLAAAILKYQHFDELFIEGGSTAYAIIQNLGINLLKPEIVLAPGIIQLRDVDSRLLITTKPGSYSWPASILPKHQKQTNL